MVANGWWYQLGKLGFIGSDENVDAGVHSWRAGPSIRSAAGIRDNLIIGSIHGTGSFWQSDEYTVGFMQNGKATRTKRRIMRQVLSTDKTVLAVWTPASLEITFNGSTGDPVPQDWINKWLVLEIDIEKETLQHFFSDTIM